MVPAAATAIRHCRKLCMSLLIVVLPIANAARCQQTKWPRWPITTLRHLHRVHHSSDRQHQVCEVACDALAATAEQVSLTWVTTLNFTWAGTDQVVSVRWPMSWFQPPVLCQLKHCLLACWLGEASLEWVCHSRDVILFFTLCCLQRLFHDRVSSDGEGSLLGAQGHQ